MNAEIETGRLTGTSWILTSLGGADPLPETAITLDFAEEDRAAGSSGCNRYAASCSIDSARGMISFGLPMSTMMACPEPFMEQERRYLQALEAAAGYRLDGSTLILLGADGAPLAQFSLVSQELAGTSWNITSYNNGRGGVVSLISGTAITAAFSDEGRVAGSAGCNSYAGIFSAENGRITVGPLAATRKMCFGEGVMAQEAAFLAALETAVAYRISGRTMEMRREDGALAVNLRRA